MLKSPEQPDSPNVGEKPGAEKQPDKPEEIVDDAGREPRYTPGEYRVEIPVETAQEDIERAFPDVRVKQIEYLSEGMGSTVFLVNGEFVFRFAKNEKADASIEKETKALPGIQKQISCSVPAFEYVGKQRNQLRVVGYRKIEGEELTKAELVSPEGEADPGLTKQLAELFRELHSMDTVTAEQWGLREQNFRSLYKNELEDARDHVYPAAAHAYPSDAQKMKEHIERLFAGYLGDDKNFEYKPAVLHGDLEAQHVMFDRQSRKITGIIDWGRMRIGDPDYDLFRPMSHYGNEFIDEFLKYYPHPDPERLRRKLDFFFRAQMVHRTVRAVMLGDQEQAKWHLERLRKQTLGIGYWYHELR